MNHPVTISGKKVELTSFKLNKAGYSITIALMIITLLIPILVSIFIFSTGGKPNFGLFISWTIFGFMAYFFYRLATWNKHGKEHFILEKDMFVYKPEAKNISYKTIEFKLEKLVVSMVSSTDQVEYNGVNQNIAWLKFDDGEKSIQTNIKTPQSLVIDIIQTLENWGIKNDLFLEEIKD